MSWVRAAPAQLVHSSALALAFVLTASLGVGCGGDESGPPLIAPDSGPPAPPPLPPPLDAGRPDDAASMDSGPAPVDAVVMDSPAPPVDLGAVDTGRFDSPAPVDSGTDAGPVDRDRDGVDDSVEDRVAYEALPFLSLDPTDGCALGAVAYRVRPHPADAALLLVRWVALFERDCGGLGGIGGHVGDNEGFSATVDPRVPGPEGILALRAIAHRGTACDHSSTCGRCPGIDACSFGDRRGVRYPVVYFSKNKHGGYVTLDECNGACFLADDCVLATTPFEPPMVNLGEPDAPLVTDLTAAGIITAAAGWTEMDLFGYDPWGPDDFGGAGNVAGQLMDDAFVTPACTP